MLKKILISFLMLLPTSAFAWWNEEWPYRAALGIDTTAAGANIVSTQGETTALLRLHAGNFQDFFLVKEDLSDLRFIAGDDKTPLKFHVEKFDLVNQLLFVWVKLPQVAGNIGTEKVWMYYGNAQAQSAADVGGSFDADTATIIHFKEGAAQITDETSYASPVTNQEVAIAPASLIAAGAEFKGNGRLLLNAQGPLAILPEQGVTFSAWIKPDLMDPETYLLQWSDGSTDLSIKMTQSQITAQLVAGGKTYATQPTGAINAAAWQHVSLTLSKDQMTLYVNERQAGTATVSWQALGGQIAIGNAISANAGFTGQLDEIRFDRVARSADWVALVARNQGMEDKLLKLQPAEQLGAGGGGHGGIIQVILESNDAAGWAVMIICFIMALGSWFIMLAKGVALGRMSKDNRRFLSEYEKLGATDPASLDRPESQDEKEFADSPVLAAVFGNHDHFQSSPIYHMYHRGIEEVRARLGNSVGARAAGLTPAAVESIRAMLDAKMTREMQLLNKYMIFLVITVSGGPFMGLLGTVIGVMITFGAIAATGDVNIAAIAPGVAAALSATVAGLVAAIPALFGYNYLSSRIKEQGADMRVFADEFIAKLSEHYGNGA
jgi:biopolymer transport protein ExbB